MLQFHVAVGCMVELRDVLLNQSMVVLDFCQRSSLGGE